MHDFTSGKAAILLIGVPQTVISFDVSYLRLDQHNLYSHFKGLLDRDGIRINRHSHLYFTLVIWNWRGRMLHGCASIFGRSSSKRNFFSSWYQKQIYFRYLTRKSAEGFVLHFRLFAIQEFSWNSFWLSTWTLEALPS